MDKEMDALILDYMKRKGINKIRLLCEQLKSNRNKKIEPGENKDKRYGR